MDSSDQGEDSFLVEFLNPAGRLGHGRRPAAAATAGDDDTDRRDSTTMAFDRGTAAEDDSLAWDDGGEYARAAEAAGVDVGGMLEAGVDAKKLLGFVSRFHRREGDKLGLLDERNLKFATSQVLREGPRAGVDAVNAQLAGNPRSRGAPTSGAIPLGRANQALRRVPGRQPLQPRGGTFANPKQQQQLRHLPSGGSEAGPAVSTDGRHGGRSESARPTGGRKSAPSAPLPRRPFDQRDSSDEAETSRLCDELLRWSSALQSAEKRLGGKGRSGGFGGGAGGNGAGTIHRTRVPIDDVLEEGSKCSTSTTENAGHERSRVDDAGVFYRGVRHEPGRPDYAREEALKYDRGREQPDIDDDDDLVEGGGDADVDGDRDRSRSLENNEALKDIEEGWGESELRAASFPRRGTGGGVRRSVPSSRHERPTPSYALPTKHFKALDRYRKHSMYAEDAPGQNQLHRQAHLEDENAALKLRLEGQRRAIHELEHQASTLRDDARLRQEELSELRKKISTGGATGNGRGRCPCCASTHPTRVRGMSDTGPSALKKRALAAEARTQTLERSLSESKTREQRSREIVASLKHSHSDAQAKMTRLEAELESTKESLTEARQELVESRRNAKVRLKATQKQRRQQGEKERDAEIARAEAAELATKLRKALRAVEKARREAIEMREDKARLESESQIVVRENRMLRDRLSDGKVWSKARERDRWILAELRSDSRSPARRSPQKASHASFRRQPAPSPGFRTQANLGRRLGAAKAPLDSISISDSSDAAGVPRDGEDGREEGAGGRVLRPRDSRPVRDTRSTTGEAPGAWSRAVGGLSTRSIDGNVGVTAEGRRDDAAIFRGSTLSGVSARSSTMGARYEKLQAMYRRVNRRDGGSRGRAGVG